MEHNTFEPRPGFFARNSWSIKGVVILFLSLVLLIPALLVGELIRERSYRRSEAEREVSQKWAGNQQITGPMLIIPYQTILRDQKGAETGRESHQITILPESLDVQSSADPLTKKRGIYEFVLYNTDWNGTGKFTLPDVSQYTGAGAVIDWAQAAVVVGMTDLKGLMEQPVIHLNGESYQFEPGLPDFSQTEMQGIHKRIGLAPTQRELEFKLTIKAKGSGMLRFAPVGKTTRVQMRSNWPSPRFDGSFLPETNEVTAAGFSAQWQVLHMNRSYPQVFTKDYQAAIAASTFGVDFITPVDNYTKSERSVKYALLFIGLTFLGVFFLEIKQKANVHPFHYTLIGLALVIFYTLLVSISEHTSFNTAYMVATLMIGGLIMYFVRTLFRSARAGALVGVIVALLYGFLFVTLQSEDYALLLGSFGIFVILAVVMYFAGRIRLDQA